MLEDASMLSSLVLAQATLLILIVAIVATGVLAYVFQNREHNSDKKLSKAESTLQFTEKDLGRIESNYWGLYHENERLKVEVKEWQDRHSALFTDFDRLYRDGLLERWFIFLERSYFRNRAEISAFLFLPMLWFLEYPESAFHLDEPIPLIGSNPGAPSYVSFTIYGVNALKVDVPLFLLDTIPPTEKLTTGVLDAVKLKALSAKVLKYCITNGDEFVMCNLLNHSVIGPQSRHFTVREMRTNWLHIRSELHNGAFKF